MSSTDDEPPCTGDDCSGGSELTVALVICGLALLSICCYVRYKRASIFVKANGKFNKGKNYQPLSRRDFDSMVQGVFDDSDEESLEGDLEMGGMDFNRRDVKEVKTKLDFEGDFGEEDD
ncbi:hypothetical protein TrLO_g6835 [Triparma laevis f. longispina]|uniref:Uncharacterized protein n=1 Tax=Triparma laevis f. longispina TaxID=1714387 RepID=A0A9W7FC29_9STRA|nr:hypothetical protein TrLO_g6835 [Triparma laevis f. longispina]